MNPRIDGLVELSPFLGLHRFFTADEVAGIDAAADFVHGDNYSADTALIGIPFFDTLLRNLCHFLGRLFYHFLFCHDLLLSSQ
jgi:hypothetical protein